MSHGISLWAPRWPLLAVPLSLPLRCVTTYLSLTHPPQAEHGSLPRPGVSADGDKLLALVHKLAAAKGGEGSGSKVEVDEALVRKFASGETIVVFCCVGREGE